MLLRRIAAALLLAVVLPVPQAGAATAAVVFTQVSQYYPGDTRTAPEGPPAMLPLILLAGNDLEFHNFDLVPHSLTSSNCIGVAGEFIFSNCPQGKIRLFDSGTKDTRESGLVLRAPTLAPGVYKFHCTTHPSMRGAIDVRRV